MPKVAAIVVIYNPDQNVIDNINTYINQVNRLFVIDNSETINDTFVKEIKSIAKVDYICNYSNLGIATALNIGAKKAIAEGFEYLLTMDQDSKVSSNIIEVLLEIMQSSDKIGIVTADHINPDFHKISEEKITTEVLFTMTNGNLLNLSAYCKAGDFKEKLFIDHVDHEYCLRLNSVGYKILKTNRTFVYHKLGKAEKKKFLNFNLYPTYHSPLRLYYRTRNRFYVDSLYKNSFPDYVKVDRMNFIRELIDIILCEKDLFNKFKMIIKGYIDFRKNRFGKLRVTNRK